MPLGSHHRPGGLRLQPTSDERSLLSASPSYDRDMPDQECILLPTRQGSPHDSLVVERSLHIGAKVSATLPTYRCYRVSVALPTYQY